MITCVLSCGQVQTIVKVPHEGTPLERLLLDNSTQWFNLGQQFFATSWVWESLNVRPLDSQNLEMLSCVKVPHTKGTFICSTRVMVNVALRRKCLWGSCGCVQQTTYAQGSRKDRKETYTVTSFNGKLLISLQGLQRYSLHHTHTSYNVRYWLMY